MSSTDTAPRYSVIVAVHNVAELVGACLDSVTGQSVESLEVIAVDDGSTDASGEILTARAEADPRIRVVSRQNGCVGAARNSGLAEARGELVAFLDGDDTMMPDFLARLDAAMTETGCDWAACGTLFTWSDNELYRGPLSGHGDAGQPTGRLERIALDDWRNATDLLTSPWNKLYRRSLLSDATFDENTWFEDQTFLLKIVERADAIACLDAPLHRHSRHREGQITSADHDRVFDQFPVMDGMARILDSSSKPGAAEAKATLISRVLAERLPPLHDRRRRGRFIETALAWLQRNDISFDPTAADRAHPTAAIMSGRVPVSVIIPWNGFPAPLHETLTSLDTQVMRGAEVIVVGDGFHTPPYSGAYDLRYLVQDGEGPGRARNAGLAAASGETVVFLDAGDRLAHWALAYWVDSMLATGADVGISAFRVGFGDTAGHAGFHDAGPYPPCDTPFRLSGEDILQVHLHPSAKIFRRRHLTRLSTSFGPGPFSEWPITIAALIEAGQTLYFPEEGVTVSEGPNARDVWRATVTPFEVVRALRPLLGLRDRRLPRDWRARLAARAIWEKTKWARHLDEDEAQRFAEQASMLMRLQTGPTTAMDRWIEDPVRRIFNDPRSILRQSLAPLKYKTLKTTKDAAE